MDNQLTEEARCWAKDLNAKGFVAYCVVFEEHRHMKYLLVNGLKDYARQRCMDLCYQEYGMQLLPEQFMKLSTGEEVSCGQRLQWTLLEQTQCIHHTMYSADREFVDRRLEYNSLLQSVKNNLPDWAKHKFFAADGTPFPEEAIEPLKNIAFDTKNEEDETNE